MASQRRDLPFAHLLLDRFRQQFDQRQTPRHPTDTTVETPPSLLYVAKTESRYKISGLGYAL